jgi:hypothetical protein
MLYKSQKIESMLNLPTKNSSVNIKNVIFCKKVTFFLWIIQIIQKV